MILRVRMIRDLRHEMLYIIENVTFVHHNVKSRNVPDRCLCWSDDHVRCSTRVYEDCKLQRVRPIARAYRPLES